MSTPSHPASSLPPLTGATVGALVHAGEQLLLASGVGFGHGTTNARDEAAWLVLWRLGLPLDSPLDDGPESIANQPVAPAQQALTATLFEERIRTRKPAAYLTREAWLQGVSFYVDERAIVPRSFIAELIVDGGFDDFLGEHTQQVLDLCTGNGSLAVLAAMAWPEIHIDAADISEDALAVARINVDRHGLQDRIRLLHSGGQAERVTFHGNYNVSPSISPDGHWLAYISRVGGGFKLYVMDLQTGTANAITDTTTDESPSFAPNSRLIVYATQQQGREALMTTTVDGKIKARLSGQNGDIREPDWGPYQKQ